MTKRREPLYFQQVEAEARVKYQLGHDMETIRAMVQGGKTIGEIMSEVRRMGEAAWDRGYNQARLDHPTQSDIDSWNGMGR